MNKLPIAVGPAALTGAAALGEYDGSRFAVTVTNRARG